MRNLTRISLCLTLSLLLAAVCGAQQGRRTKRSNKRGTAPPREGVIISSSPPDVATEVRQVGNATINYYGTKDETMVFVELPQVYEYQQLPLELFCHFNVAGKKVVRPESVLVQLSWDTLTFRIRKGMRLFRRGDISIEADGRRFNFKAEQACDTGWVESCDMTLAHMDFASFEQIVNSKRVKVRVEPHTFELSETQLDALRDMLRAIEPAATKP
ncbi:MAG TPA: hypothetical protein VJ866_10585 [Pyrinomonadaceae bacterium]|nr:hypothetical protein [Pyrinomonadaceae bacterium]